MRWFAPFEITSGIALLALHWMEGLSVQEIICVFWSSDTYFVLAGNEIRFSDIEPLSPRIKWPLVLDRRYENNGSYFSFSRTLITTILTCPYLKVTSFTKLRLFSRKVSFIMNTIFPPLLRRPMPVAWNSLLQRRSSSHTPCSRSSSSSAKRGILGASFRGPKIRSQRVLNWDCVEDERQQIGGADFCVSSHG
jgi:hypothetical protein